MSPVQWFGQNWLVFMADDDEDGDEPEGHTDSLRAYCVKGCMKTNTTSTRNNSIFFYTEVKKLTCFEQSVLKINVKLHRHLH